ncbi:HOTHEAD-like protein, partial [Tanacetum coccineum]
MEQRHKISYDQCHRVATLQPRINHTRYKKDLLLELLTDDLMECMHKWTGQVKNTYIWQKSYVKRVGWDAKLVNESYPWVEKQVVHEPIFEPWQRAVHDGLLDVGVSPDNGFTYDHLYGTKVGGTIFDRFGRRHTAAAELLASANPKNIVVLIHARAQKIVFDTTGKKPRAVGVVFKDENGAQHEAFISKRRGSEVIVTCGAIGSPQMLLLSGIGPKADLEKLNIPMVHDNELVGKNMQDNPMNAIYVPFKNPVKQSLIETVGITKLGVYIEASSGY